MLPEAAVARDPRVGLAHRAHDEAAAAHAPVFAAPHESRALQHPQVSRDGGQRDAERPGQGADRLVAGGEPGQHGAARGVGEGGEGGVEAGRFILNHVVKYHGAGPAVKWPTRAAQNTKKPPPDGNRGFTVLLSVEPKR